MVNLAVIQLPIRAVQAAFALIVLGLTSYVAHWSVTNDLKSPSPNNFMIFTSIWTILTLVYLLAITKFVSRANHPFAVTGAEALATIFWFAGFLALARAVAKYVCFGHVCSVAKAATVFGGFEFLLWIATLIIATLGLFRGRSTEKTEASSTGAGNMI